MRMRARAVLLAALAATALTLPPVKHAGAGTTSASSNVITSSDTTTCTVSAASPNRGSRGMNEGGGNAFAQSVNAWLFDASCDGGANSFEIRVHPDFAKQQDATTVAEKYGKDAGRLPKVLRSGIPSLSIHKGNHGWFTTKWGGIRIYTGRPAGYHEEILFHEAAHLSLEPKVETLSELPKWKAAQTADGAFISSYARNNPVREDIPESFLAYFSAAFVPTRISKTWKTTIDTTIPNRIAYFDGLLSADDMKPFTRVSGQLASVSIAARAASATEGGNAVFTLTASPAPSADLTVTLTIDDDAAGDFLAGSDEGTRTVTINANQTTATLTLATVQDSNDEPDGAVTATLVDKTGYRTGSPGKAEVAVSDDDATSVTLATPDAAAAEGDATDGAEISLTLGRGLVNGEVLAAALQFAGGVPGQLFTLACPQTLPTGVACRNLATASPKVTFTGPASGASATSVTLSLAAADDSDTDDETVTVSIPASSTGNAPVLAATGLGGGATGARSGDGRITISDTGAAVSDACVSAALRSDVVGYAGENHGAAHQARWNRVLTAFDRNAGGMTAAEAKQMAATYSASRWDPVVTALQCIEGPLVTVTAGNAVTEGGDAAFTVKADPVRGRRLLAGTGG